jgi:hypothetical protein
MSTGGVVTARCTVQDCKSREVYTSSPIRAERHRLNAWNKAARLARSHAVETNHRVDLDDGDRHAFVECRCSKCQEPTPGNASGVCLECLKKEMM